MIELCFRCLFKSFNFTNGSIVQSIWLGSRGKKRDFIYFTLFLKYDWSTTEVQLKYSEVSLKYEWSTTEVPVKYREVSVKYSEVPLKYDWSTDEVCTPEVSLFPPWLHLTFPQHYTTQKLWKTFFTLALALTLSVIFILICTFTRTLTPLVIEAWLHPVKRCAFFLFVNSSLLFFFSFSLSHAYIRPCIEEKKEWRTKTRRRGDDR